MAGSSGSQGRSTRDEAASRQLWRLSAMGFELASHIVAGGLIGWLVDWLAGTTPTGVIVGLVLGVITGMLMFIRGARKAAQDAVKTDLAEHHDRD